jgi:8-oxo-dGTP pyrophosphatase MutT (NUDIX family)/GNAT superfamily N-acetyltransferase
MQTWAMPSAENSVQIDDLTRFLKRHKPVDAREEHSVARMLAEFARLESPFSETADPFHVTASAIVVGARGVILHRHKRLGIWIQPGGHVDPGELLADAALREVLEETGLPTSHFSGRPSIIHVDVHPAPKGHTHLDVRFLLRGPDADPAPPEGGSPDVSWLSFEAAKDVAEAGLSGLLQSLPEPPELRAATTDDAPGIAECYLASFNAALPGVVRPHTDHEVRDWIGTVMIPQQQVTVAVHRLGMIVGFCASRPGRLEQLYIDPAWQSRGIGTVLLHEVKQKQPDGFSLWTFQQNENARRFYEQQGFVAVEFTNGSQNEERTPDVRYQWQPITDQTLPITPGTQ